MSGQGSTQSATLGLILGALSLVLWPLSYTWLLNPGSNPSWAGWLVPLAECGAIACAVGAIWLGSRARRQGETSTGAIWAPRLGAATLLAIVGTFLLVATRSR